MISRCPCCRLECKKCINNKEHEICDWMKCVSYTPFIKIDMPSPSVTVSEERKRAFLDKWLCLSCGCRDNIAEGKYIRAMKFMCKFITRLSFFIFGCWIVGLFFILFGVGINQNSTMDATTLFTQFGVGFGVVMLIFFCSTRCCCQTSLTPWEILMT